MCKCGLQYFVTTVIYRHHTFYFGVFNKVNIIIITIAVSILFKSYGISCLPCMPNAEERNIHAFFVEESVYA